MSVVMFATRCDTCNKKSPEYSAWPSCWSCHADVCYDCVVDLIQGDGDPLVGLCKLCKEVLSNA